MSPERRKEVVVELRRAAAQYRRFSRAGAKRKQREQDAKRAEIYEDAARELDELGDE